jgi:hypothetical protein
MSNLIGLLRNKGYPLKNIIKRIKGLLIKPKFFFGGDFYIWNYPNDIE